MKPPWVCRWCLREEPSRKRQREKARKDPILSKKPDLPVEGHGHGGRLGTAKGTLLTQYLLRVSDYFFSNASRTRQACSSTLLTQYSLWVVGRWIPRAERGWCQSGKVH